MRREIKNKLGAPFIPYKNHKCYTPEVNALFFRALNGIPQACALIHKNKTSSISHLAQSRAEFHASCVGDCQHNWQNYTHLDDY